MNEIMNWMQGNWYSAGSLLIQLTVLFAGLWFASKILKTMRATQQQFGALLRLSMTDGLREQPKPSEMQEYEPVSSAPSRRESSVVSSGILGTVGDRPASYSAFEKPPRPPAPSLSEELSGRAETSAHTAAALMEPTEEPTPYVSAPLTLPEGERSGGGIAAAGRGVVQWLNTPMASKRRGTSPLRKVVRWLQAPAGQ